MNFSQLKYIVAVDKHRNFNRAAHECNVAQSTLSKEIQRLEKEFNIIIFDRSRHPVVPTLKGKDIIKHSVEILKHQKEFIATALTYDNLPAGEFRLGILSFLAPYLLPLLAQKLNDRYPRLELIIEEAENEVLTKKLSDNALDAVIGMAPFQKEGFYETKLFQEEFALYLHENHPLAGLPEIHWKDIPQEELILHKDLQSHFCGNRLGDQACKIGAKHHISGNSLETIRKIVDRSGGMTIIPELASLYMGERRKKMLRTIKDPSFVKTISLVAPRGFEKKRILKVLRREIRNSVPSSFE